MNDAVMDDDEQYRVPQYFLEPLRSFVHDLVLGNYEALTKAGRLTAAELQHAVQEYGRTLVDLPADAFDPDYAHAYLLRGEERQWAVDLDLWTQKEGRSDLTLQLLVVARGNDVHIEVQDLHVM